MAEVLLVTSAPFESIPRMFVPTDVPAVLLELTGILDASDLPIGWTRLTPAELIDAEEVRQQFLTFLDTWPTRSWTAGKSFEELFTRDGRYSIWWTSVGANREVTHSTFKYFRYVTLLDRAIERSRPKAIVLNTKDPLVAALVHSRAEYSAIEVRLLPECGPRATIGVTSRWFLGAVRNAFASPLGGLFLAIRTRWALRGATLFRRSERPTVVFTSRFTRYLQIRDGTFSARSWSDIVEAIRAVAPEMDFAYLPWKIEGIFDVDGSGRPGLRGTDALRGTCAPLLIRERCIPVRGYASAVIRQILTAWQFYRIARRDDFQRSFRHANTDLAPLFLPPLREAIDQIVEWSFRRAQFASALRSVGSVKALVLSEEMYRPSMPILAAAADCGIPAIGVQHGTVMPLHLVYRVPRGHLRYAPLPDYFAAFSEYAKETTSVLGAYPAERVWVTGPARLDPLVNSPIDQREARKALGLSLDSPVVVLATQTFPWFVSAIRAVLIAMHDHPNAVLCIKKHPDGRAMSIPAIESLAAQLGTPHLRCFEGDIERLLAACDVWIGATSTTLLEATLIGRATICVNFTGEPDEYPYVEDGASLPARSVEELKRSLTRALTATDDADAREHRRAFLRRHAGPTAEGRGAVTFARRLMELVSASRRTVEV
jgi:hypothetical protein